MNCSCMVLQLWCASTCILQTTPVYPEVKHNILASSCKIIPHISMWIQKKLWWHLSPPILGEAKPNFGSYNYHKDTPPIFHLNSTHKNAAQIPQSESDWQIKAQYLSPVVVRRAHWGVALSPFGTSLGQLPWLLHLGLQKSPDNPWTRTACSSDSQPVSGLP